MDLEQRVVELERRATRYRNTLVLLVVGVCAVAVVGATTDDGVISGRALFLTNDQGEVVIYAGASTNGNGQLTVASKSGTDLIYAGADTDGDGQLKVKSKSGTDLIYAGASTNGNGQLRVASKSGTNQLVLGATRGGAVITLSDNPNIARVVLSGGAEGGSLALYDEAGETVWYADSGSSQGIASAPEDKRAGLKQGPEEIRTAGPRPPSDDAARPTIRSKCAEEWGDDFEMQKYCQDKQFEALANLRARNMASGAYATIRKKCSEEWGADYKMRLYCEEKQVEAYSELNR